MSEPRLRPLARAALEGEQAELFDTIANGPRGGARAGVALTYPDGSLIGPFNPLLFAPALGQRIQAVGEHARFSLELPKRLGELAILVVARTWRAQFEWYAHARLAATAGVSAEVIEAVRTGAEPPFADELERLVYDVADAIVGTTHRVPEPLYRTALATLGERQLVELTGLVGYYCLVSALLNTFEVPLPEGVEAPFAEPGA